MSLVGTRLTRRAGGRRGGANGGQGGVRRGVRAGRASELNAQTGAGQVGEDKCPAGSDCIRSFFSKPIMMDGPMMMDGMIEPGHGNLPAGIGFGGRRLQSTYKCTAASSSRRLQALSVGSVCYRGFNEMDASAYRASSVVSCRDTLVLDTHTAGMHASRPTVRCAMPAYS